MSRQGDRSGTDRERKEESAQKTNGGKRLARGNSAKSRRVNLLEDHTLNDTFYHLPSQGEHCSSRILEKGNLKSHLYTLSENPPLFVWRN